MNTRMVTMIPPAELAARGARLHADRKRAEDARVQSLDARMARVADAQAGLSANADRVGPRIDARMKLVGDASAILGRDVSGLSDLAIKSQVLVALAPEAVTMLPTTQAAIDAAYAMAMGLRDRSRPVRLADSIDLNNARDAAMARLRGR